ncbi:MAG: hypothetical protein K1060chlam4_01354 [Candidatus Anoxychlamydiales bacterium]|nr:hypothetical protein [Candidatus Anoxychlamydiales bacterium]
MKNLDLKLKKKILAFCFEDTADLLSIECIINDFSKDKKKSKENTLRTLQILLDEKLLKAGWVFKDGSFKVWKAKSNEIIKEIKEKWDFLDRELLLGDIVWFEITEKGRKEFEYLNSISELKEIDPFYFDDK